MDDGRSLVYFADPMCSWCWGFSPVFGTVRQEYGGVVGTEMVMGGLRAGNTRIMDEDQRQSILGHWRHVHDATGQPFDFSFRMPEGFIYDTEPPCRAVVAMGVYDRERQFPYMEAIQRAFYARNMDVTDTGILVNLAAGLQVNAGDFEGLYCSDEIREKTIREFSFTAGLGVSGFPTVLGRDRDRYVRLLSGYRPFEIAGIHL